MNRRKIVLVFISIALLGLSFNCKKENDPGSNTTSLSITGVSIPADIEAASGGAVTFSGKGFALKDHIQLVLVSDTSSVYVCEVTSVTDQAVTFNLPQNLAAGTYKLSVIRGEKSLLLGSATIHMVVNNTIADKDGMNLKGGVYCNGKGVAGAVVSDGYEVTTTDKNGIYYLSSEKKSGFVFISIPSGYEVSSSSGNLPQFFKKLEGGTVVEQHDFYLTSSQNTKHVVLTLADIHLANRNDDITQFASAIADINLMIAGYKAAATKVYALTLGDMSWDAYWYANDFALPGYVTEINKINCQVFNVMGNHDNDPYCADDKLAESKYKNIIGPTYYSFNLGNVHYVVLDNVQYINTGGSEGVIGNRNYNDVIDAAQLEWLKKDLATIKDKSAPLIIAMHTPLFNNPSVNSNGEQINTLALTNGNTLVSCLGGFGNVHILSGHTHVNYTATSVQSIMEHNTAAICATWWWTGKSGYAGNHICTDGSPGGYGVWEIDGNDVKWLYKGIGKAKNYQFRTYDLNKVHITAAAFAPNSTDAALSAYTGSYGTPNLNNEVLINVWGYDPQWKIEVRESGNLLPVQRIETLDPLHIISYEAQRLNVGATPTSAFVTSQTSHFFKVKASSAASTLEITVTDRFGNIYTQTMTRPKDFNVNMN